MVGRESLQILRIYEDNASSATGSATRCECDDGSTWRERQPFEPPTVAVKCGDRIYPQGILS